jgi:hypothetical protein
MRVLLMVAVALLLVGRAALAQELDPDPNRIFVTQLNWKSVVDAPGDKSAAGTLAILYAEGVYAEVATAFSKRGGSRQIDLNLKDASVVRLGTWQRLEDSDLIRIESREISAEGESKLSPTRTCRLEHPSPVHIADGIVCKDLVVFHAKNAIGLSGFPARVRQMVTEQEKAAR